MRWVGVSVFVLVLAAALVWALRGRDERSGGAAPSVAVEELEKARPNRLAAPKASAPAGEGAGEARTAVAVEPLVLAVFDPDGAPLAGGRVVVFQDAQVLGEAVSGEAGEVRFTLPEGEGEVAVWAPWLPAHRQKVALRGRHELRLAGGPAVAGMVLVDGLPPGKAVELQLFSDSQVRSSEFFPPSVMAVLGLKRTSFAALRAQTDAAGRFRFSGLPEVWAGRLEWEGELFLAEGPYDPLSSPPKEVALASPAEDVVLRLAGPGLIQARFVTREGKPIGSASVEFDVPALQRLGFRSQPCAADGTYRRLVQLPFPDEIVLRIASPARDLYPAHFRSPPGDGALWDLGDVVVPPAPRLRVEVRDEAGAPVVGAEVQGRARGRREARINFDTRVVATDETGAAALEVGEDLECVRVDHKEYAPVVAQAPQHLDDTLAITLRPRAALNLEFELVAERQDSYLFFIFEPADAAPIRSPDRGTSGDALGNGDVIELPCSIASHTVAAVAPAGVPLRLRVTDRVGRMVHEDVLPPLAPGAVHQHRVKVEWKPATLRLRVLDALERPVAGAGVLVDGVYRFWTGLDGRVEAPGLAPGLIEVTICHRLHVEQALRDVALGTGSEPLVVHLAQR